MSSDRVTAAVAAYTAAAAALTELDVDRFTHPELLELLTEVETITWKLPTLGHRVLARLQREASPTELGAKSLRDVLKIRLRISLKEAKHRLEEATELGPRVALNGEPLAPVLDQVAATQAAGTVGPEHVTVIREFLDKLPGWVDHTTKDKAQRKLTGIAGGAGPDALRKAAHREATLIDQDGPQPNDAERARKRGIHFGPQQANGLSRVHGYVTPEFRPPFEPITAKLAAPGMCNPDDEHPCTKGTPSQQQIDADMRNAGQRTHDALLAIGRSALSSGDLGQHNGLPATIVVTTTLQDLQAARGSGVTGGGSLIPMSDVIKMASHAHHYLAVFDKHTNEPLYLGRSKRIAPAAHRIVLYARDRGCTFPGCTVPAYGTQVHHTTGWKNNGRTDIINETLACGGDNRLAEDGWTVVVRNGIAEWIPPPHLDTGQARTNHYHHPERLLAPDDDEGT